MLGIDVDDTLLERWMDWFAPDTQPFLVCDDCDEAVEAHIDGRPLPMELLDTFELYGTSGRFRLAWLDEHAFLALDRTVRATLVRDQVRHGRSVVPTVRRWRSALGDRVVTQADGHRFVWWRSLMVGLERRVLTEFVTNDRPPSRHLDVPAPVWERASSLLPGVRDLAGSFPEGSGPNCFAAVMAAAGVPGAGPTMMVREPFESWLDASTRAGGRDGDPGCVLVWRTPSGDADHAAVTLGDGWAVHKPSQGWMSPCMVLPTHELIRVSRHPGLRLHRYRL